MKINKIFIDTTDARTDLCDLGVKYPTDKSPYNTENLISENGSGHRHPYTAVYDMLFSSQRYKKLKIAEIGVLDNMSMRCWREYFPNAELYGFDFNEEFINQGKSLNLENTTYDLIDIKSQESIEQTLNHYGKFDIIIEDSTHIFEDQIRFCQVAYKYLNEGGILIIEDIFRNEIESRYINELSNVSDFYISLNFIITEHQLKYSPEWDNDKLMVLYKKG